ncbi:substrate binding domain-containing protein [Paraburkholderia dipogonis]|uniref:substrate binding domain-containing protein n=1 Tax=Paraburkholderia dipogonis TaxID=1211383 RepID=UPI0038B7BC6A
MTLTEAGRILLEKVREIVADIDDVEGALLAASNAPSGTLRIAVQGSLGAPCLARILKDYGLRYPDVTLQIALTSGTIDLVEQRFDVAIAADDYPHHSSVVRRRLAQWKLCLVATSDYLALHGVRRAAVDLAHLHMLYIDDVSAGAAAGVARRWVGEHAADASHLQVNNAEVLRNMALEGMGVALLPLHLVQRDLIEGRLVLVPVPTDEPLPTDGLSVAYASRRNLAPSVRTFVDFLVEAFEHETLAGSFERDDA